MVQTIIFLAIVLIIANIPGIAAIFFLKRSGHRYLPSILGVILNCFIGTTIYFVDVRDGIIDLMAYTIGGTIGGAFINDLMQKLFDEDPVNYLLQSKLFDLFSFGYFTFIVLASIFGYILFGFPQPELSVTAFQVTRNILVPMTIVSIIATGMSVIFFFGDADYSFRGRGIK